MTVRFTTSFSRRHSKFLYHGFEPTFLQDDIYELRTESYLFIYLGKKKDNRDFKVAFIFIKAQLLDQTLS